MKRNLMFLFLPLICLCGCDKTNDLYSRKDYNSPEFDENYYLEYDGLNSEGSTQKIHGDVNVDKVSTKFSSNMIEENKKFSKGILSKLYDGRTECGGLYQLSRVQLDRTGFGTILPDKVEGVSKFCFAARGGTKSEKPIGKLLHFNFEITLFTKSEKHSYLLENIELPTDYGNVLGAKTTFLIDFALENKIDITGYTMSFSCLDLPNGITDNYKDTSKTHLAVMLYEVYLN